MAVALYKIEMKVCSAESQTSEIIHRSVRVHWSRFVSAVRLYKVSSINVTHLFFPLVIDELISPGPSDLMRSRW